MGSSSAASYAVEAEREVTLYLDVMMTIGHDFDRDAALPWPRDPGRPGAARAGAEDAAAVSYGARARRRHEVTGMAIKGITKLSPPRGRPP